MAIPALTHPFYSCHFFDCIFSDNKLFTGSFFNSKIEFTVKKYSRKEFYGPKIYKKALSSLAVFFLVLKNIIQLKNIH